MGLDGGTLVTRTDVLRGSSWRLANSDGGAHRSSRGGQLGAVEATSAAGVERRPLSLDRREAFETCALSGEVLPLRPAPGVVVACGLGNLYLRDAVCLFLARTERFAPDVTDLAALTTKFGHIRALRDVFPLALEPNPRRAPAVDEDAPGRLAGAWRCPVSGVETNGVHSFVALRPCGHVLRQSVAKEMARGRRSAASAASAASAVSAVRAVSVVCA